MSTTTEKWAIKGLDLLAEAATQQDHPGYLKQAALKKAIGVTSDHTMNEVVTTMTRIVKRRYAGCAVCLNKVDGYRLRDKASVADLRSEQRRLKTARTMLQRAATVLLASGNESKIHDIGVQIETVISVILDPALDALDKILS